MAFHHRHEQALLAAWGKGVAVLSLLLLLEKLLGSFAVDSLASVGDLERPFDILFVEAQLAD